MKKVNARILICIISAVTLLCSLGTVAFAEEEKTTDTGIQTETLTAEEPSWNEENFFTLLYESAAENSEEIFSFMAFLGTMIIALIYNKGLLPTVKGAVKMISEALSGIKDENERVSAETKSQGELISLYSEKIEDISQKLDGLSEELERISRTDRSRIYETLLDTQVELLRDVFVSSSLPHHQKEAVEAKVKEMRKALKKNENMQEKD